MSLRLRFIVAAMAITGAAVAGIALFSSRLALRQIERVSSNVARIDASPASFRGPLTEFWNRGHSWTGVTPTLARLSGDTFQLLLMAEPGGIMAAWPPALATARVIRHADQSIDIETRSAAGVSRIFLRGSPRVPVPDATLYILPVETADATERSEISRNVNRTLFYAVLFAFAAALLAAVMLSRYVLRPVSALTTVAGEIAEGRYDQRVPAQGRDEIGRLAASINTMGDRLAHTEQLRRNMVGDISHELRTPLTRLQCQVEAIQDGLAPATLDALRQLHAQILHLGRLVDDLQDLSLSDAGQLKLTPVPLQLDALIREMVREFALDVPVQLALAPDLPPVLADRRRIRQIFENVISNAIRSSPQGAQIHISAVHLQREIEVRVQDAGPGIPPEHLSLVFERFHQVDDSRTRSTNGSGLGPAIVKLLVEAHGGRVRAENSRVGTTLIFTLPTIA